MGRMLDFSKFEEEMTHRRSIGVTQKMSRCDWLISWDLPLTGQLSNFQSSISQAQVQKWKEESDWSRLGRKPTIVQSSKYKEARLPRIPMTTLTSSWEFGGTFQRKLWFTKLWHISRDNCTKYLYKRFLSTFAIAPWDWCCYSHVMDKDVNPKEVLNLQGHTNGWWWYEVNICLQCPVDSVHIRSFSQCTFPAVTLFYSVLSTPEERREVWLSLITF